LYRCAAVAAMQRERDAAVARVAALEAASSALQPQVTILEGKVADATSASAAQLGLLRTQLKAAEANAAVGSALFTPLLFCSQDTSRSM
jgi:hypothetical protein